MRTRPYQLGDKVTELRDRQSQGRVTEVSRGGVARVCWRVGFHAGHTTWVLTTELELVAPGVPLRERVDWLGELIRQMKEAGAARLGERGGLLSDKELGWAEDACHDGLSVEEVCTRILTRRSIIQTKESANASR